MLCIQDFKIKNQDLTVTKIVEILAADDPAVHNGKEINLELEVRLSSCSFIL